MQFTKLDPEAKQPEYKSEGAAGVDFAALEATTIKPGETVLIRTGIAIAIPTGYVGIMAPRSSLALKQNLSMPNSIGIIDSDYRGEIFVGLRNLGQISVTIEKHERISQMLFLPYPTAKMLAVDSLDETSRGAGGFGSTGKF